MRRRAVFVTERGQGAGGGAQGGSSRRPPSPPPPPRPPAPFLFLLFIAAPAFAQIFTAPVPFTMTGTAAPNARVRVDVEGGAGGETVADANGNWSLLWTAPLKTGTYDVRITAGGTTTTTLLRVQLQSNLQRQSPFAETPPRYGNVEKLNTDAAMEMTDRWRIAPPPYELDENPKARTLIKKGATLDPYNKNLLKGHYMIRGNDTFLVFTGVNDTLAD